MASLSTVRILDAVRVRAPGLTDGVLRMELFNAAKKFLADSAVWREYLNIFVDANAYDYDLVTASRGVITTLMMLGKPHTNVSNVTSIKAPDYNNDESNDLDVAGTPAATIAGYPVEGFSRAVSEMSPRRGGLLRSGTKDALLRILDLPNANEIWIAEVALTVGDPTDGDGIPFMPWWIEEKYHDVLVDGVLSRVMTHPAKPYTSEKAAMFHGRKFLSGIGTARTDARHGGLYGAQRWRFPQQFRTRSQRTV